MSNQNAEQLAETIFDRQLTACGWVIQSKLQLNLNASLGVAVEEYQTDVGPAELCIICR